MDKLARVNGICPYFTMYPLAFPLGVLKEHRAQDALVVDPFCGRGTTNFAARLRGYSTIGVDTNPLAVVIAEAKLSDATGAELRSAFSDHMAPLRSSVCRRRLEAQAAILLEQHEFWRLAFTRETLVKLLHLRDVLANDPRRRISTPLRALAAGALHGPVQKTKRSYFSNQAPRTFSPKPDYSVRFWKARGMAPPVVPFEEIVTERIDRYYSTLPPRQPGRIFQGDSRAIDWRELTGGREIDLAITSPPYFGMTSYSSDQWLRLWFLGGAASVDYSSRGDLCHRSKGDFAADLRSVWKRIRSQSGDRTRLVIRMGSIPSRPSNPVEILEESLGESGWRISAVHDAGDPGRGKRQQDHFGRGNSSPAQEVDVHCKTA